MAEKSSGKKGLARKVYTGRSAATSLEIGADNFNHILGRFFGGLGIAWHVIADVVLHQFGHEGVDGAASGGEALEDIGAMFVVGEAAENAFELADDFLGAVNEVEFFSGCV